MVGKFFFRKGYFQIDDFFYMLHTIHTLIRVRSEGGDRFSENPEIFSKNASGGGDNLLLSPPCPPPGFALRGGTIFQAEGGTRVGLGGWGGGDCPPHYALDPTENRTSLAWDFKPISAGPLKC